MHECWMSQGCYAHIQTKQQNMVTSLLCAKTDLHHYQRLCEALRYSDVGICISHLASHNYAGHSESTLINQPSSKVSHLSVGQAKKWKGSITEFALFGFSLDCGKLITTLYLNISASQQRTDKQNPLQMMSPLIVAEKLRWHHLDWRCLQMMSSEFLGCSYYKGCCPHHLNWKGFSTMGVAVAQ